MRRRALVIASLLAGVCIHSVAHAQAKPNATLLGEEGESCRARADCGPGLKCIDQVCIDAFRGSVCEATSECGGKLRCIANVCTDRSATEGPPQVPPQPGPPSPPVPVPAEAPPQAPPPPVAAAPVANSAAAPAAAAPSAAAPPPGPAPGSNGWMDFKLQGLHPHVGLVVGPGASLFIDHNTGNVSSANTSFLFGVRGGVFFANASEAAIEISPFTYAPFTSSDPVFQTNVSIGKFAHIAGPVYWPLRVAVGFVAGNLPSAAFQTKLELVGVAFNVGHVLVDLRLPSLRMMSDFEAFSVFDFHFGGGVSYVF